MEIRSTLNFHMIPLKVKVDVELADLLRELLTLKSSCPTSTFGLKNCLYRTEIPVLRLLIMEHSYQHLVLRKLRKSTQLLLVLDPKDA